MLQLKRQGICIYCIKAGHAENFDLELSVELHNFVAMKKMSKIASDFLYLSLAMAMAAIIMIAGAGRFHHHDSHGYVCVCAISHILGEKSHDISHHENCDATTHNHLDCEHHPDGSSDCPTVGDGLTPFGELSRAWLQSIHTPSCDLLASALLASCIAAPKPIKSEIEAIPCSTLPHILSIDIDNVGLRAPPVA